ATIGDESGNIKAIWFNQPYIANALRVGREANFAGKVSISREEGEIYLSNPAYELVNREPRTTNHEPAETRHTARLVPIYPETRGLTSKGLRFLIQPILKNTEKIPEWIPPEVLAENNFPDVNSALALIHFPNAIEDALLSRKRFAFEDLFLLQIWNLQQKLKLKEEKANKIRVNIERLKELLEKLPFALTTSQKKSLWEIAQDMEKGTPMNRLLQGDVGSGKTVVAALAAIVAAENGFQTAFMAPTEILARQHFETMKGILRSTGASCEMGFLTASGAKLCYEEKLESDIPKKELREHMARGEVKIVIGTHALISEPKEGQSPVFKNLAFVVVDEQHRFGVKQRSALLRGQTQTRAQTGADPEDGKLLYKDLSYLIRGSAIRLKETIGLGHKEIIYQKALVEEFEKAGISFEREKRIPVQYADKKIGTYQPDFVVDNKIIVEIKALPFIGQREERQLWTYLKGSEYKVALMINFSPTGVDFKRIVFDSARSPRKSASGPRESAISPHFLSMSATPIPRTLMMTVFGDLDISTITELPAGRKDIVTKIVPPTERTKTYAFIREEVGRGRQVFVICPRIDPQTDTDTAQTNAGKFPRKSASGPRESALWELKSVKEEYEKLSKKIFPDLTLAMLHGQMKPKEKEKTMREFAEGKTNILVSTSVVEVGVDIKNASIMMIEGSDRFGLAQLYQFRGRVGRGEHQSYCFLFTDSKGTSTNARLRAIVEAKNGFELAEKDLKLRGPGEFLGQSQSGLPDVAMNALRDPELVKSSRAAATKLVQADPSLQKHQLLKSKIEEFQRSIHLE
ncbi:MAG: GxxExxY protein, partial [Candidatus Liptonbacteria bacterium]|nr:GxxExxY protein [Candidatus Liptonbacteria bacterium]